MPSIRVGFAYANLALPQSLGSEYHNSRTTASSNGSDLISRDCTFLQVLTSMSSSLAPECNEVKECVAVMKRSCYWLSSKTTLDATIHVSLSGTAIVRPPFILREIPTSHSCQEFLRGESTTDECDPLFKNYKTCLTVGVLEMISLN